MGGAISAGRDNNELVDKLIRIGCLRSAEAQRAFRAVDRGDYFLPAERESAYADLAWKSGALHLSAPCIYCDVVEALRLRPGLSFLNLGSGTGYLSTVVGLVLGARGVNHGVELHAEAVEYARERLARFRRESRALDELDFAEPRFARGDCLRMCGDGEEGGEDGEPRARYDRVYCGAACPRDQQAKLKRLVKVGGVLVVPLNEHLVRFRRTAEDAWVSQKLLHVSFSTLQRSAESTTQRQEIDLPDVGPPTLQTLARAVIRGALRATVARERPALMKALADLSPGAKSKKSGGGSGADSTAKTVCISIDDENSDSDDLNDVHNLDLESGSREMNALLRLVMSMGDRTGRVLVRDFGIAEDDNDDDNDDEEDDDDEDDSSSNEASSEPDSSELAGEDEESDGEAERGSNEEAERGSNEAAAEEPSTSGEDLREVAERLAEGIQEVAELSRSQRSGRLDRNRASLGASHDDAASDTSEDDADESKRAASEKDKNGDSEAPGRRKRHLPNDDDEDEDEANEEAVSPSTTANREPNRHGINAEGRSKAKRRSPPRPHPYDVNRNELSELMQRKVFALDLPMPLKKYVNMNRDFSFE